jgi:hypothetical protein
MKKHLYSIDFLKTLQYCLLSIGLFWSNVLSGQCNLQVLHIAGTEQVGCTSVEVISEGDLYEFFDCGAGPHTMGVFESASATFNFTPAISSFRINVTTLDYCENGECIEEMRLEINGAPYLLTAANAGVVGSCYDIALISGAGTLQANPIGPLSSMDNLVVDGLSISSLKVIEDCETVGGGWCAGINFSLFICPDCSPCTTDAGVIAGSAISICDDAAANFAAPTQTNLEADDLLQYILFTDLSDTLGSIVATSNTPIFSFNPISLQYDVEYYAAAIAGNGINGNVDLSDPCLDISNAIPIIWRTPLTVAFSVVDPSLCAGDCVDILVTLTGLPPFDLTYSLPLGGVQTEMFTENNGVLLICLPENTPPGNLVLQALSLTNDYCACP